MNLFPGFNLWKRLMSFFGRTTAADLIVYPPASGGRVIVQIGSDSIVIDPANRRISAGGSTLAFMDGRITMASDGSSLRTAATVGVGSPNIVQQLSSGGLQSIRTLPLGWVDSAAEIGGNPLDAALWRRAAAVVGPGGGDATTGGIFELLQVASGGTPSSNSGRLYAKDVAGTAELFAMDEAGNETQISPHAMDGPADFYDLADEFPHVVKEVNHYTGHVRYIHHSRFVRAMQALLNGTRTLAQLQALPAAERRIHFTETFAEHNARTGSGLVKRSWAADQAAKQADYDAKRAEEAAALSAWNALPADKRSESPPTVRPARDIRKPVPAWLAARGVS